MLSRLIEAKLIKAIKAMPVVALLGSRQVGKTTLAIEIAKQTLSKKATYLDLELDSDLSKLNDPETYFRQFENQLLIIDEVQQKPELFRLLRGLVDVRKRNGETSCQFLILGSASRDLLQQSSETLAGRIRYLELSPFSALEVFKTESYGFNPTKLWLRGGFPNSYLATDEDESWDWRSDFISTYLERDLPLLGPKISPTRMRRFWTMLAHYQGQQVDLSSIGKGLDVSHTTVKTYLDILTDFYMVRQVRPWAGNTKKRLIKSPKVYIRDSGLLHRLLNIPDYESLLGHPVVGFSWEGFVIESIITILSDKWQYSYYRTSSQSEIDLVLEGPNNEVWAVEIKRSVSPSLSKGFHTASEDIKTSKKYVIYQGEERYPITPDTEAIGLIDFLENLYQKQ